jgi:hypothetical protein
LSASGLGGFPAEALDAPISSFWLSVALVVPWGLGNRKNVSGFLKPRRSAPSWEKIVLAGAGRLEATVSSTGHGPDWHA